MKDYRSEGERYWAEHWGPQQGLEEAQAVAEQVLTACGLGSVLDVGCGLGLLVRTLLGQGVDARGVDISPRAVAEANRFASERFGEGSLLALPFPDESFDTVTATGSLEFLAEEDVPAALAELYRVSRHHAYVRVHSGDGAAWASTRRERAWWEERFFEAGFRKHPAFDELVPYESLEREGPVLTLLLEKVPAAALATWPLAALGSPREDPLRESGRRSEAHVARYALASRYVRDGDVVLDVACGRGAGSHLLRCRTGASRVVGLTPSDDATAYARACFAHDAGRLSFEPRGGESLASLSEGSVDLVVAFEALEHVPHPERFLSEVRRVLRPGGRVVVGVPDAYSRERLKSELQTHFHLEAAWRQVTGLGGKSGHSPRRLSQVPVEPSSALDAEAWVLVAMVDPNEGRGVPFSEVYYPYSSPPENLLAFGRDYDNPWLVRGLVEYPTRAASPQVLRRFADTCLAQARVGSPDQSAALAVLGYQVLGDPQAPEAQVRAFIADLRRNLSPDARNPHELRWRISLSFLLACLLRKVGELRAARDTFEACATLDWRPFSPTIGTKTVEAWFHAGLLSWALGEPAAAREAWRRGVAEAEKLLGVDWKEYVGRPEQPLRFPLRVAVEFLDAATRCTQALAATYEASTHSPSLLWKQVRECWKWMLDTRWRAMGQMERMIRERDETIAAQARLIEERWAGMQQMEGMIRERDETIAAQARLIEERGASMQRMEGILRERDETIAAQARLIEERGALLRRVRTRLVHYLPRRVRAWLDRWLAER
ncbi:methyltransferase domain-containing protein [Archangium minus]|uniref:Methyltransferase domain-containing protein n=1 Tax=Archangium minus TaxID=83450 RepID=A0ABY9WJ12_9BACT|nr:methyltransferase domain-containing protein [Archangium minus]